ncbi:MAG: hypothetical protein GF400_07785, partial [Candidatus Eisenbacteria bacterium]|nr:hypothetical protein [Candidatus Eisenbacteria bacterium]
MTFHRGFSLTLRLTALPALALAALLALFPGEAFPQMADLGAPGSFGGIRFAADASAAPAAPGAVGTVLV